MPHTVLDALEAPHALDEDFAADVLEGLGADPKWLSSRWLYDARGSELFEDITELPEYYPTRTEISILKNCVSEIADLIGPGAHVIEYGSGSSRKTSLLLDALEEPEVYVPVEISESALREAAERISERHKGLRVSPVVADFTQPFDLPDSLSPTARRLIFFPGSTLGNFTQPAAEAFLRGARDIARPGDIFILGADRVKDPSVLVAAYDDAAGVTAAFNKNLLVRINRELGANFDVSAFRYRARYDEERERVHMHLVSQKAQTVRIAGASIAFEAGETIHTEDSHKYTRDTLNKLATRAGWNVDRMWTDPKDYFGVFLLTPQD